MPVSLGESDDAVHIKKYCSVSGQIYITNGSNIPGVNTIVILNLTAVICGNMLW